MSIKEEVTDNLLKTERKTETLRGWVKCRPRIQDLETGKTIIGEWTALSVPKHDFKDYFIDWQFD